jgi:Ni/Co efflux regulator RcnB
MKSLLMIALAAGALGLPLAASAKDHGDGDRGHDKHKHDGGPPGLAKKDHGMPPGQAKKHWGRGEHLPASYISQHYYIAQPTLYHLPPAPYGQRWVLVEDNAYLADTRTGLIANVIANLLSR